MIVNKNKIEGKAKRAGVWLKWGSIPSTAKNNVLPPLYAIPSKCPD
jgi:hypothetical protein